MRSSALDLRPPPDPALFHLTDPASYTTATANPLGCTQDDSAALGEPPKWQYYECIAVNATLGIYNVSYKIGCSVRGDRDPLDASF